MGLTQGQLAKISKLEAHAQISAWENNHAISDYSQLLAIHQRTGVDGHWLLRGQGAMDRVTDDQEAKEEAAFRRIASR